MPHQCAHWFAMTCRGEQGVCVCKDAVHDDMQKGARCLACKDVICNNMQKGARCLRLQGCGSQ